MGGGGTHTGELREDSPGKKLIHRGGVEGGSERAQRLGRARLPLFAAAHHLQEQLGLQPPLRLTQQYARVAVQTEEAK